MRVICYKVLGKTTIAVEKEDGTVENIEQDLLCGVEKPYSIENEELAKKEAYNGEYTIEDDGIEEVPTKLDMIEAQVAYLAIVTGNKEILDV